MPYIKTSSTLLAGALVLLAVLLPATSAHASRTVNACFYDLNSTWGDIPITIESTPVQSADKVVLTQTRVNAELPQWAANYMSIFGDGPQTLQVTAWVALAGLGSSEGVQVKRLEGTATTTVTGATGTPFVFTAPLLEDTSWSPAAAALTFQQAGPKGLPDTVPAGPNGAPRATKGSVYILARKPAPGGSEVRFTIDCQPGTTPNGTTSNSPTFTPGVAQPFASLALPVGTPLPGGGTTPTPGAGIPTSVKPIAIRTTKLAFGSKSVKVAVTCPTGGPACRGSASVRTRGKVKLGKRSKVLTIASGSYTVPAGAKRTVTLKLSKDGTSVRKRKKQLGVQISLRPNTGGKATTKKVTLRRR